MLPGGAGTWSDGKLTTRIGRNARDVRDVLRTFVGHGAPAEVLVSGAPRGSARECLGGGSVPLRSDASS